jgi:phosphatidylinositol 4-kinase A
MILVSEFALSRRAPDCSHLSKTYRPSKKYLAVNQSLSPIDSVDLGASVGENYGEVVGPVTPVERKVCTCIRSSLFRIFHYYIASLATLSKHKPDRAKIVTS